MEPNIAIVIKSYFENNNQPPNTTNTIKITDVDGQKKICIYNKYYITVWAVIARLERIFFCLNISLQKTYISDKKKISVDKASTRLQ